MKFVRLGRVLLSVVILSVLCASPSLGAVDKLEEIIKKGELVVAVADFECEPFFFEKDGELAGLDADLGRLIAEEIGVKVRFVRVPWDGLIALSWYSSYPWSRFDMAISIITIKESRARACDFSQWYFYTGQKLLVRRESGYDNPLDLEGKTLAVMAGSTGYDSAKSDLSAQTVVFETPAQTVQALLDGKVDGTLSDATVVITAERDHPELVAIDGMITTERYGVVLPKGSKDLKTLVDRVVVSNRKALYDRWFK